MQFVFSLVLIFAIFPTSQASALPSENIVILQLQAFGDGSRADSSYEEFILLYNSSNEDVNVTDWCIEYASSTGATITELACIKAPNIATELYLEAGGYVSFATSEFVLGNPGFVSDFTFIRKLSNSSGHVWLLDSSNNEVDRIGWGGAIYPEGFAVSVHNDGEVLSRDLLALEIDTNVNSVDFSSQFILNPVISGLYEQNVLVDLCTNIEGLQFEIPSGYLQDGPKNCYKDFCPNLDGLQIGAPSGYFKLEGEEDCELVPLEDSVLFVTELLANAPSYDTGQEFIELYNPNSKAIELKGYRLQLGLSFSKEYVFVSGVIKPGEYLFFSDIVTGIVLPNSSSASVRLVAPAGNTVSETAVYSNSNDNVSWALVSDVWIYTNQITPGSANKPYLEPVVEDVEGVTSVLAPCPAGKYRNPETNRCKSFENAVAQLVPCGEDEYRNPETNRCNKIISSSSLEPCPEGQERNPETNRCRKVSILGSTTELSTVTDLVVESSEGQLNWPIILASVGGTIFYMLYEWRNELRQRFSHVRAQ
jgi:hypothetical protein